MLDGVKLPLLIKSFFVMVNKKKKVKLREYLDQS